MIDRGRHLRCLEELLGQFPVVAIIGARQVGKTIDNGDGTCETIWTLIFTAINEEGNAVIEAMPDKDPDFEALVFGGLEHFLKTGERMTMTR